MRCAAFAAVLLAAAGASAADLSGHEAAPEARRAGAEIRQVAAAGYCAVGHRRDTAGCAIWHRLPADRSIGPRVCQRADLGARDSTSPPQGEMACAPLPCLPPEVAEPTELILNSEPARVTTYPVTGDSCMAAGGALRDPAGMTETQVESDPYTYLLRARRCADGTWVARAKIQDLTLRQRIEIQLPQWNNPAASEPDREAFADFRGRLMAHERLHEQLARDQLASKFGAMIRANTEALACGDDRDAAIAAAVTRLEAQFRAAFMEVWNETQAAQQELDAGPDYPILLRCP